MCTYFNDDFFFKLGISTNPHADEKYVVPSSLIRIVKPLASFLVVL